MTGIAISTVYDLGMPKMLYIQLYVKDAPVPQPLRLRADKFEREGDKMLVRIGNEQVGEFNVGTVAGWWIQDE